MKTQFNKFQKGFTLIELMIVISIIGLLAGFALPNFITARKKSMFASAQASLIQIESGYEQYIFDTKTNLTTLTQVKAAITPDYIRRWPVCPGGGSWIFNSGVGLGASNLFQANISSVLPHPFCAYDKIIKF